MFPSSIESGDTQRLSTCGTEVTNHGRIAKPNAMNPSAMNQTGFANMMAHQPGQGFPARAVPLQSNPQMNDSNYALMAQQRIMQNIHSQQLAPGSWQSVVDQRGRLHIIKELYVHLELPKSSADHMQVQPFATDRRSSQRAGPTFSHCLRV